ncbi:LysR substrate-binding domain-containing protein [Aliiglaciecola litoralis]|uniref:LysR substrate-binding domain-containing protein n=1 Tax=Aliiglaciecola litoralis TaxID=582857 RepID=A0ABN1LFL9_9ALTE
MHHGITLEALRVIEAIHLKGSFSEAAKSLFKVPSALTYTVQKLESDLGVALFDRKGQRAKLTQAGNILLQEGEALLRAAQLLEQKVKQVESGWETNLVIAKDTIIKDQPVFDIIQRFCTLGKQVEVQLLEEALGGGWDALHTQRCDVAIGVTGELPKGQYDVHQIGELEFVFAVAKDHPLADYVGVIEGQEISQYPSIVVADSARTLPQRSSGIFHSKQTIRVQTMAAKLLAQQAGLGVGFLPLHLIKDQLRNGELVVKSTSLHRPPMPIYMAWHKGKSGKALAWFVERCKQQSWL